MHSPSKVGPFERKCVEEALLLSTSIAIRILPEMPRFLPVLVKIFDATCVYYSGSKGGTWTSQYQGYPQVRLNIVKKFAGASGFNAVLSAMKHPDATWLGTDALAVLVKAMCDSITHVSDESDEELAATVARSLLTLSDEQLKRENTDVLHSLIRSLGLLYTWASPEQSVDQGPGRGALAFQSFWLEHTLKVVNSGFLVVKVTPGQKPIFIDIDPSPP